MLKTQTLGRDVTGCLHTVQHHVAAISVRGCGDSLAQSLRISIVPQSAKQAGVGS